MELRNVIFERAPIAIVTINRPAAMNALNRAVIEELSWTVGAVAGDASIRVLIITGAGDRAFVAGADIETLSTMSPVEGREFMRLGHGLMRVLEELAQPVIAAVDGYALGGGLELALACDLAVASERARFGLPETGLGIIPGFGGTQRLAHRIGHARAREAILTGEMFDAAKALEWGLVNRVVPAGEALAAARALADKLATRPAVALAEAKAALHAAATMEEDAGLSFERRAFAVAFASEDRTEGTRAFIEKRKPAWRHR